MKVAVIQTAVGALDTILNNLENRMAKENI